MLLNLFKKNSRSSEIFNIRGFQRSGTNWICNIANLHDQINCQGEFHFQHLYKTYNSYQNRRFSNEKILKEVKENFKVIKDEIILKVCNHSKLCGDRTPCNLISTYVPGRKNILITRDGRDCIISWLYHCLRNDIYTNNHIKLLSNKFKIDSDYYEVNKHKLLDSKYTVKELSKRWNNRIVSDYKTYIKSVKNEIDMPILWLRYENVSAETEKYQKNIYEFLNANPKYSNPLNEYTTAGFKNHNPLKHYRIGKNDRWRLYFTKQQHKWFLEEAQQAIELLNLSSEF